MTGHPLLSDADLEPVSDAQLHAAIAVVAAMSEDDFCDVAEDIGLDVWSGMSNGSKASRRRRFKGA